MAKVWKAREAEVKIAPASLITITTGTSLNTIFASGSSLSADMKGLEITEPEMTIDKIDLLGDDSNGFQNADVEEKPAGMAKISGTLMLRGDESPIDLMSFESGTSSGTSSQFTRYQRSNGTRKKVSLLVNLDDGTDEVDIALHDCFITTMEPKLTGADGHFEVSFAAETLPKNWYLEFKN